MKVGLVQLNPTIGDFKRNTRAVLDRIEEARREKADLVVFPELTLTGYPTGDFLDYRSFIDDNLTALEEVTRASHGITVVCGYVEPNPKRTGKACYNAAAVLRDGKQIANYRKQLLPFYNVFDEQRYFEPAVGEAPVVFDVAGEKVGLSICEDAWNFPCCLNRLYEHQPLSALKGKNLALLVNLSASPFSLGRQKNRQELFREAARYVDAPVAFCNQVGATDELLFDGCSMALDRTGVPVVAGRAFKEEIVWFDTSDLQPVEGRLPVTPEWPKSEGEWLFEALVMGIRDYARKCGASKVCLGLSGGVDSSVVAPLAVAALGKEAVLGIALPTRYTSNASSDDAAVLAERLGIAFKVFPIETLYGLFQNLWRDVFHHEAQSLTLENIQPRLRMTVLMAAANEENRLVLNTSNKSEVSTGFATLYGDTAGALSVLGDLTKAQVYAVARYINRNGEVIPERVLSKAPTAELKENQTDEDVLPPYSVLDALVKEHVEGGKSPRELVEAGFEKKWVDKFERLHAVSEYKRRQLPPALRVSARAFGMGRKIPIAAVKPR